MQVNICANKHHLRIGLKGVQWCFETRTQVLASEISASVHKRTLAVVVELEVIKFKGAFKLGK
jgi:hypothetical protein